tara:strand:- start:124 stop:402 length:279 start_codon:yes stop_codon:yes gene_type:complete
MSGNFSSFFFITGSSQFFSAAAAATTNRKKIKRIQSSNIHFSFFRFSSIDTQKRSKKKLGKKDDRDGHRSTHVIVLGSSIIGFKFEKTEKTT